MKSVEVTIHAAERMAERMGVSKNKIQKVAEKAWLSKEPITNKRMHYHGYQDDFKMERRNHVYRQLMGYIFIFAEHYDRATLVTIYTRNV